MLPAKISYFINNARYSIGDYLVLFYVQAGLSPTEAGLVNGLQHLGGMFAAPLFGFLADKYGFHRLITICLCLTSIIAVCIQPYFTLTYGAPDNNYCPRRIANITLQDNVTSSFVGNGVGDDVMDGETTQDKPLFYSLLVSAIVASSFDGSIMSFNEAGVLTRVETSPRESSIGVQRIMAALGSSVGAIIYSLAITFYPHGHWSCHTGLFVTYGCITLCLAVSYFFLFRGITVATEQKKKETGGGGGAGTGASVTSQLWVYLRNRDTIFFLATVFVNGAIPATWFSYLFLYLKHLNASTMLFGVSISFNCVSGILLYAAASHIIKFLGGPMRTIAFSCLAWAARMACLAYIVNPYWVLLIDIFHGFTFSLFRVASLEHIKETTDLAIFSSVCGVVNALSYSLSFLIANVVGGMLFENYGPRKLFLGAAAVCVVWTVVMVIYISIFDRSDTRKPKSLDMEDDQSKSGAVNP